VTRRLRGGGALVVALLATAVGLLHGCTSRTGGSSSAPPARASLILISIDTTRADHLGCYGYAEGTSPHVDRWAREGVVFEQALSPVPITLPAHATLLTGYLPHRHGVRDNGVYRLPGDVPTLAGRLSAAGYNTAAVVASAVLDRQYGLARGFTRYDDPQTSGSGLVIAERPAAAVTDAALAAARTLQDPFFLFVHYFDPHAAYAPPGPFAQRFRERPYDGEIAYVDSEIERLRLELGRAGRLGGAVVVVTSDHGEGLGEHGEATHGVFLYNATLHVPLVVIAPGRWPAGRRVAGPVSLADVAPTLAELAGLAPDPVADGQSLTPLVAGTEEGARVFPLESEFGYNAYGWAPLVGLFDGRFKWIRAPQAELYDLATDPGERHNILARESDRARSLARRWREVVQGDRRELAQAPGAKGDSAQLARLRALGYVAESAAPAKREGPLPDPKRAVASLALINDARSLIARGRFDEAASRLERALRDSPRNLSALVLLGSAHLMAGHPRRALGPLQKATEVGPANAEAAFNLGLAWAGVGDASRAEEAWRRTLALAPRTTDAAVNLIDLLSRTERPAEAEAVLADARKRALESPLLDLLEGRLTLSRGDRLGARLALEKALRGNLPPPAAAEARALLARASR